MAMMSLATLSSRTLLRIIQRKVQKRGDAVRRQNTLQEPELLAIRERVREGCVRDDLLVHTIWSSCTVIILGVWKVWKLVRTTWDFMDILKHCCTCHDGSIQKFGCDGLFG